jgi:hypothetical protein
MGVTEDQPKSSPGGHSGRGSVARLENSGPSHIRTAKRIQGLPTAVAGHVRKRCEIGARTNDLFDT